MTDVRRDQLPDAGRLHRPLEAILRPLVKLCIRSGLTYPALAKLLCALYVNVAEHEFGIPGKSQTDSRVSLLTGINRKEVARLRGAGAPVHKAPASVSRTSQIVAQWLASSRFTDADGNPLPLPRQPVDNAPSFEELVALVTRDVHPRSVLDEWIDRGIAAVDEHDRVQLREEAFAPRPDDERKLYYFSRNLHDHVSAAAANIGVEKPPFFERAVHYDGLSVQMAAQLEAFSRKLGMDALQKANREAHKMAGQQQAGNARWIFGIYIYRETGDEDAAGAPGNGETE
ncbi:DUF6502 family protein [Pseudochelatococcus lubricantis]|uniref:DUF6502 family protein n=1 Tax=Pseudochelatococcus lubricantis TaxID=1538102 RepID=UPI0035E48893